MPGGASLSPSRPALQYLQGDANCESRGVSHGGTPQFFSNPRGTLTGRWEFGFSSHPWYGAERAGNAGTVLKSFTPTCSSSTPASEYIFTMPGVTPGASFGSRSPATPAQQPKPQPLRNAAPALVRSRKDWSEWEDRRIHEAVAELGLRWRAIASRLPGRSDDAVRNRWLRLGGEGVHKPATAPRSRKEPGEKQRQGWSAQEDAIIAAAVAEIGNRWNRIVELLPNKRTEHAIRNRWHRLQMAPNDGRDAGHIEGLA